MDDNNLKTKFSFKYINLNFNGIYLLNHSIKPKSFAHFFAKNHIYSHYGSQAYLRKQSGLGVEVICGAVTKS
jgi:hypothetical protein